MVITNLTSRVKVASAMSNALVSQNIHENAYNFPIKFTVITIYCNSCLQSLWLLFKRVRNQKFILSKFLFTLKQFACRQSILYVSTQT